jgi:hypothetical protein
MYSVLDDRLRVQYSDLLLVLPTLVPVFVSRRGFSRIPCQSLHYTGLALQTIQLCQKGQDWVAGRSC